MIIIFVLVCELVNDIINTVNEKYIINNEETGVIKYNSDTLHISINPIKKINPNVEIWEVSIKIKEAFQIKFVFAGGKFSLTKKEKTSRVAMRNNAVLAINGATFGFNERSYVIRDGIVYRETILDCDPLVIQENGDFIIYDK